jgi:hypothetical protein
MTSNFCLQSVLRSYADPCTYSTFDPMIDLVVLNPLCSGC